MNLIGKESVENTEMELEELLSAALAEQLAQLRKCSESGDTVTSGGGSVIGYEARSGGEENGRD